MKLIKTVKKNWRLVVTNYVGCLGYYWLVAASLLWFFGVLEGLGRYLLVSGANDYLPAATPSEASHELMPVLWGIVIVLTVVMILFVVALLITIPYIVGRMMSWWVHQLFRMTGRTVSYGTLLRYQCSLSGVLIITTLLTLYDYRFDSAQNSIALFIIVTCVLAMGFFGAQYILARRWKLRAQRLL